MTIPPLSYAIFKMLVSVMDKTRIVHHSKQPLLATQDSITIKCAAFRKKIVSLLIEILSFLTH